MQYDFSLDGTLASSVGLCLQGAPSLSPVVPEYKEIKVPGRDGVYHIFDSYAARTIEFRCYALKTNLKTLTEVMEDIYTFLFVAAERQIILSTDTEHYYKGVLTNGGEIADRLDVLNPFTVTFQIDPFKYEVSA
jgi:predicted phage tail component-like protein